MQAEAGKGSKPREGADQDAFATGWDRIFGKKKREEALAEMVSISEELGLYNLPNPMIKAD